MNGRQIDRLLLDPKNPKRLYAYGYSIYKSNNGGKTWSSLGTEGNGRVLILNPASPNILYAAGDDGLFTSGDYGRSWAKIKSAFENLNNYFECLALDHTNHILYAGTGTESIKKKQL